MAYKLYLFGPPQIAFNDEPLNFRRRKGLALLTYLAVTQRPQSRELLLGLFWPEFSADSARNNLRRELSLLRKNFESNIIQADGMQVGLDESAPLIVDILAFQSELIDAKTSSVQPITNHQQAEQMAQAVGRYGDDFLAGFSLPNCVAFEDWQLTQAARLRQILGESLSQLVSWHSQHENYDPAIYYARRWVALDGLEDAAQLALIKTLALAGQKAAALRQFDRYKEMLAEELDVEPEPEALALYGAIRDGELQKPTRPTSSPPPHTSKEAAQPGRTITHNLPAHSANLLGRQSELEALLGRLDDPNCRLLTVVGQGGIGKTVLATKVGQTLIDHEPNNTDPLFEEIYMIMLQPINERGDLVATIAAAFGLQLPSEDQHTREDQLVKHLFGKRALIILDNFEHLADEADLVAKLISQSKYLKLLVTSREALMLSDEWVYPLQGLTFPQMHQTQKGHLLAYSAIDLYVRRATRVQANFDWEKDQEAIIRNCQLVGGSPLGIELAASWSRVLSSTKIAEEIEKNFDFLTAQNRDIPKRHRSMRAVLTQSWEMLNELERQVLQTLSLFRAGFDLEAAETVAQTSIGMLANLVDKSFLTVDDGRYFLHELTRQFAYEKLEASGLNREKTDSYTAYYLDFVAAQYVYVHGLHPDKAFNQIRIEYDNIRQAWTNSIFLNHHIPSWAVIDVLTDYYEHSGFFDGHQRFGEAIAHFDKPSTPQPSGMDLINLMSGYLINSLAYSGCRDAEQVLARMSKLMVDIGTPLAVAKVDHTLGSYHMLFGNHAAAVGVFEDARFNIEPFLHENPDNLQAQSLRVKILHDLGGMYAWNNEFEKAEATLIMARNSAPADDVRSRAIADSHLGTSFFYKEEFDRASASWRSAIELFEQLNEKSRTGRTINNLSIALLYQEKYQEALEVSLKAIRLLEKGTDIRELAFSKDTLGEIYLGLENYSEARACFKYALDWANREQIQNEQLLFMTNLAEVDLAEKAIQRGLLWIEKAKEKRGNETPTQFLIKLVRVEGDLLAEAGDPENAITKYDEGLALLGDFNRYDRSQFLIQKAICYLQLANQQKARPLLEEGIDLSDQIGRVATLNRGKELMSQLQG